MQILKQKHTKFSEIDPRALAFFSEINILTWFSRNGNSMGAWRAMSTAHGTESVRVRDDSMDYFGDNTGNLS